MKSQVRNRGFGLIVLLLLASLALLVAFRPQPAAEAEDGPLRVVTTIGQIADAAQNVGGDLVEVESLMGPGIDPHLYKASEGDIFTLLDADLILYNGLHLEGRMGDVLEELANEKTVVAVAESIPSEQLLAPPEFAGQYDPHVWFDPTMWSFVVDAIEQAMIEADPANAESYMANADAYQERLAALDAEWREQVASIPEESRVLVTAHDAFNYFGRHFGLDVVGLQGISTETEAGVGDLQAVAKLIVDLRVPAIFIESSVSPRTIEAVQAAVRDQGIEVAIGGELFSDAMGPAGTEEGTYLGMVDHNVSAITKALGGTVDE